MELIEDKRHTITVVIQRNNYNQPFAKILYDGVDAYNLGSKHRDFANYLSKKMDYRPLCFSYANEKVIERDDYDYEYDSHYCVIGSEHFKEDIIALINSLINAILEAYRKDQAIINLFVSDGHDTLCILKDSNNYMGVEERLDIKTKVYEMAVSPSEVVKINAEKRNTYLKKIEGFNREMENNFISQEELDYLCQKVYQETYGIPYDSAKENRNKNAENQVHITIKGFGE